MDLRKSGSEQTHSNFQNSIVSNIHIHFLMVILLCRVVAQIVVVEINSSMLRLVLLKFMLRLKCEQRLVSGVDEVREVLGRRPSEKSELELL
jgi:hypothetical protein